MLTINDQNTKMPLFLCELPEGFTCEATLQTKNFSTGQKLYPQMYAQKGGCQIYYQTGETYVYEKKPMANFFGVAQRHPLGSVNESGLIYGQPTALKDDLDQVAANILQKKVEAKDYYDPSKTVYEKIIRMNREEIDGMIAEVQMGIQAVGVSLGVIFRNYLHDGGIGVYEDGKKILAVFLSRVGSENDIVSTPGFSENITGEPFGQASDSMGLLTSNCSWRIPYVCYMISEDKKDLGTFMNFVDSVELSQELMNYVRQLSQQQNAINAQRARLEQMETQATINMLNAAQQQRFAAMDRLSASLSQDMDNFRSNLNASIAANDQRFNLGGSTGESSDDRLQRMRHESIMGVETYERNDGSTVEYSNMADRVFENNLDSTTHFGTHHYFDDYVPEGWHELKKK